MDPKLTRVFSGIQPTGTIHIGNYLGSIKNWLKLQDTYESIFCVVDLHAITVKQDPAALRNSSLLTAATYIACGIDINKSTVFKQSDVPEHAYLAWLLGCVTPYGWLNRMTQFKDKSGKNKENSSTGLYTYPILMAADILLYKATLVPVGDDQTQHLELAREIAKKFNATVGKEMLPLPTAMQQKQTSRIMSLKDPTKKMSKSDQSSKSWISLMDSDDEISKKIMQSTTDSSGVIEYCTDSKPGVSNLLAIYSAFSGESIENLVQEFTGQEYSKFKRQLAELLVASISPIRNKTEELMNDKSHLENILQKGKEKTQKIAQQTMMEAKMALGLV